jgi:hypothetical protein
MLVVKIIFFNIFKKINILNNNSIQTPNSLTLSRLSVHQSKEEHKGP